jgi:hypothetical protein
MSRNKVLSASFQNHRDLDLARVLINSNVFFWYWRCFGDGFLLGTGSVGGFPVPDNLDDEFTDLAERLDLALPECTTYKMYRGERIPSCNFNKRMDILLDIDAWIVKHVAPDLDCRATSSRSTNRTRFCDRSTFRPWPSPPTPRKVLNEFRFPFHA